MDFELVSRNIESQVSTKGSSGDLFLVSDFFLKQLWFCTQIYFLVLWFKNNEWFKGSTVPLAS